MHTVQRSLPIQLHYGYFYVFVLQQAERERRSDCFSLVPVCSGCTYRTEEGAKYIETKNEISLLSDCEWQIWTHALSRRHILCCGFDHCARKSLLRHDFLIAFAFEHVIPSLLLTLQKDSFSSLLSGLSRRFYLQTSVSEVTNYSRGLPPFLAQGHPLRQTGDAGIPIIR